MELGFGFQIMSTLFPVLFTIGFLFVFGMIGFTVIKGISQRSYNNKQPVLSVQAVIKSKRSDTSYSTSTTDMSSSSSTYYYVTFEVESGDRMEFGVPGQEFGLMAEGDMGKLTFQGTRFLAFVRER